MDEKYNMILAYEEKTARHIASKLIQKPKLSVWMILFPIVFIPYMQRVQEYKSKFKLFTEGYLYTKKIALDTANRVYKKEISRAQAQKIILDKVQENPDADPRVLNIYDKQAKEIQLLCEHYSALMAADGADYHELIRSYYQTSNNYLTFLNELATAEKEVVEATSTTFRNDQDTIEIPKVMERMEKYLSEFRHKHASQLFST